MPQTSTKQKQNRAMTRITSWAKRKQTTLFAAFLAIAAITSIITLPQFFSNDIEPAQAYSSTIPNCVVENSASASGGNITAVTSNEVEYVVSDCNVTPPPDPDCIATNNGSVNGQQSNTVTNIINCDPEFAVSIQKTPSQYLFEIDPQNPSATGYTYYLDYANENNQPLTGVVITDVLDTRIEYVPNSCAGAVTCSYDAGTRTLTWNVGNMAVDQTDRVSFDVVFSDSHTFQVNETIPNTAVIDSNETGPDQDNAFVNVRFINPDVNIEKEVDPIYYDVDDTVIYDISFENTFDRVLTGVYILDVLDSRLDFTSCTGGCTYDAATRTVRWDIGTLQVGEQAQRQLTVTVRGTGVINNKATIFTNETQPDFDDVNIIVTTDEAVIKIVKTANPTRLRRGDTYRYTLDYANPSDDQALTGVVITDQLVDTRINYVPNSCGGDVVCSYDAGTRTLTWNVGTMAIGATGTVFFDVTTTQDAALGTVLNTAVIDSNETEPDSDTAIVEIFDFALSIQKDVSQTEFTINPNNPEATTFTYTLNYSNDELSQLTGVVITDVLDSRIEYVPNSCAGAVTCSYDAGTRTLTWNVGNMAIGATGSVTFVVNLTPGTTFTEGETIPNTATIDSNETEPDSDDALVTIRLQQFEIGIEKTASVTTAQANQTYTYTITYTNPSATSTLTGVTITDPVTDPQINYVADSCSDSCTYNAATETITWNIGTLAPNATGTVTFDVTVIGNPQATQIDNTATIDSNETGPASDNAIVTIVGYALDIIKTVNQTSFVIDPQNPQTTSFVYTLSYENEGISPLTGVTITDIVPETIAYIDGSCAGAVTCSYTPATRTLTWNIGNLPVGQTGSVTFSARLVEGQTYTVGQTIDNTATINSNETEPTDSTVRITITYFDVTITKTASVSQARGGQTYTYTIGYGNPNTTGDLTNVVITDPVVDDKISYVAGSCSNNCTYDATTKILRWEIGTLTPGQTGTVTFDVLVDDRFSTEVDTSQLTGVEIINNTATIDTDQTPPKDASVTVTINRLITSGGFSVVGIGISLATLLGLALTYYNTRKKKLNVK